MYNTHHWDLDDSAANTCVIRELKGDNLVQWRQERLPREIDHPRVS